MFSINSYDYNFLQNNHDYQFNQFNLVNERPQSISLDHEKIAEVGLMSPSRRQTSFGQISVLVQPKLLDLQNSRALSKTQLRLKGSDRRHFLALARDR